MSLYKDASLVMLPSAYKDGKLLSIKPVEELGDELVTNGGFDTDSDWTKGSGSTISGGSLNIVGATYNANTRQSISLTSGKKYKISIDYTAKGTATSNTFQLGFGDSSGNPSDTTQHEFLEGSDVKVLMVTASATDASILFRSRDSGTSDLSIHYVSVKEVLTESGDFDFTRGSNLAATRVDVNGLIEKGRENLLLQSNQFDTTWWSINITETTGHSGYDGSSDAWLLTKSSANGRLYQSVSFSGVNTFSIYLKKNDSDWARLYFDTINISAYIDLRDGSFGNTSSAIIEKKIVSVGGDWYRVSITMNGSGTTARVYPAEENSDSASSGSIYIQDAQLEKGLVATDYIETGASTAQAGILEDMPRLDYSGGASCPALLLEPQRTNKLETSEYYQDTSIWQGQSGCTASLEDVVAPDGTGKVTKINATGGNTSSRMQNNLGTSGDDTLYSVFVKGTGVATRFRLRNNVAGAQGVIYDIDADGNFTFYYQNAHDGVYGIEDYGNGWHRIYVLVLTSGSADNYFQMFPDVEDGDGSVYVWGAQAEVGQYMTSYIPTYGASVTRSRDSATNSVTNTTSRTYFLEGKRIADDSFQTSSGFYDPNDNLLITFWNSNRLRFRFGGAINKYHTLTGDDFKIAVSYDGTDSRVFINGQLAFTQTFALGNVTSIILTGNNGAVSYDQTALFLTALTDSECIALTE